MAYPVLHLLPGQDKRLRGGHPWVYANELRMDGARELEPGAVARLHDAKGARLALAQVNPRSLIAARVLTRNFSESIDEGFVDKRLARALRLREALYDAPYCRLLHAEADGLPGVVVDRFADALVVQLNTAGAARLEGALLAALERQLAPARVVLRLDAPARGLEGLGSEVRVVRGDEGLLEVRERGLTFVADPVRGQKTGWYYDQADNRAFAAGLAAGRRVLDVYCHTGGFAVGAAAAGAREVIGVDRSAPALELAAQAAARNGVAERCRFERGEAFAALDGMARESFGLVITDPPAFVKSRKDLKAGLQGYRKLARAAAALVAPDGFLVSACCSHNASHGDFAEAVRRGIRDAGRGGRLIRDAGAGPDHPQHPALPESAYLKCLVHALD